MNTKRRTPFIASQTAANELQASMVINTSQQFEQTFLGAIDFLQKNKQPGHEQSLLQLPKYLLLGPTKAGKTSLLVHSGLEFILAKKNQLTAPHLIKPTKQCDWWVTNQALFLDTSEHLTLARTGRLWPTFLHLAKTHLKQLDGIFLIFDVTQLFNQQALDETLAAFCLCLHSLNQQFGLQIPLYCFLTHCDRIAGFCEFFGDLSLEERAAAWGLNFTADCPLDVDNLLMAAESQFDELRDALNKRLLWRLHHERSLKTKSLINDFSLQFAALKPGLLHFVTMLQPFITQGVAQKTGGIYLTSLTQHGHLVDHITPKLRLAFAISLEKPESQQPGTTYFLTGLLQHILNSTAEKLKNTPVKKNSRQDKWLSAITHFFLPGLLLLSAFLLGAGFRADLLRTELAITTINQLHYAKITKHDLQQTLTTLLQLQQAENQLNSPLPWYGLLYPNHHVKTLKALLDQHFQAELSQLLPQLQSVIATKLAELNTQSPEQLYATLKAYLMLDLPKYRNLNYLVHWLMTNNLYQTLPKSTTQTQLTTLLNQAFLHFGNRLKPNQNLIAHARTVLTNLPTTLQCYLIAKNTLWSLTSHTQEAKTPALYHAQNFYNFYFKIIPQAILNFQESNFVLNNRPQMAMLNNQTVITQVQQLYLADYSNWWQMYLLQKLTITHWHTLSQAITNLQTMISPQSPLRIILQKVADNTTLRALLPNNNEHAEHVKIIAEQISQPFATINALANQPQLLQTLQNLLQYLQSIANSDDTGEAAFKAAKNRIAAIIPSDPIAQVLISANQLPQPLHRWLSTLAQNSWQLILEQAHRYISAVWQTTVYPSYQQTIANHYPFGPLSDPDVSVSDFSHFFGNDGILTQFFNQYLSPFIDSSQPVWQWRKQNGLTLMKDSSLLATLERGGIISSMFFGTHQAPHVQFRLWPTAIGPNVADVILQLNGQIINAKPASQFNQVFSWPGNSAAAGLTLTFINSQKQKIVWQIPGAWALFRFLAQVQVTQKSPQDFHLLISHQGLAAKYDLSALQLINPFLPQVIGEFSLPKKI